MKAYLTAMKNYGVFTGRASRSQFWLFMLVFMALLVIGLVLDAALELSDESEPWGPVSGLVMLAHFIPSLAVQVRRLHDTDKSGWWILLNVIPLGGLFLIIFSASPSSLGANRFGPAPQGVEGPAAKVSPPASLLSSTAKVERLEKLASLKASGALDEGEFQKMKAELLG